MLGDILVLSILILLGFRFHRIDEPAVSRFAITFLPFLLAWILSATLLRLYSPLSTGRSNLWRVIASAALAAVLGASLRAQMLGTPILPVFVLVMAIMIALGVFLWRLVYTSFVAPRLRLE